MGIGSAAAAVAATHVAGSKAVPTVSVRSTSSYGKILVNAKGYTLYLWTKDKPDKSACSGPCLGVWPFVIAEAGMKGIAAWKAARNSEFGWFVAIVALSSGGILPLLYIFRFGKRAKASS